MGERVDYFPLRAGAVFEYQRTGAGGRAAMKFEVLSAAGEGEEVKARLRRTWIWEEGDKQPEVSERAATRTASGVFIGERKLFPLPLAVGEKWDVAPDSFKVASLEDRAEVPAGRFEGCLRVAYELGGGDAGNGEIFYAPGVGLVKETNRDEGEPFELELVAYRF